MAISHDSYLFNAMEFAATVRPFVETLDKGSDAYGALRLQALALYDANPQVRRYWDYYGGWDRAAIEADVSANYTDDPQDIAFWLLFFLYAQLETPGTKMAWTNSSLSSTSYIAQILNWSIEDQNLLMHGRSFTEFALKWLYEDKQTDPKAMADYWNLFRPFSTSAHMGWLDYSDVGRLSAKLAREEARIPTVQLESVKDRAFIQTSYYSTRTILSAAQQSNSCLCLIQSG
jgi:hypothetical protein